jgi:hypothetical protein
MLNTVYMHTLLFEAAETESVPSCWHELGASRIRFDGGNVLAKGSMR